jgi:abequosyltransferase
MTSSERDTQEPVRLSICIPTYNFGEFIGATLESILDQAAPGVEVVVFDGGSTDDTPGVVATLQARYHGVLRYERRNQRGGIDRDLAAAISSTKGEYCWIFCADDLMSPRAIDRVLTQIASGLDVYLCGLTICDRNMRPLKKHPVAALSMDAKFELGDDRQRREYFTLAETTAAFFSFAGSIVVRKAKWDTREVEDEFVGSCWAHVARFFSMIPDGLSLGFLCDSYLDKRSENDSFSTNGVVSRVALAVDGYNRLADVFFGTSSIEALHIRRVLANEYPALLMIHTRAQAASANPSDVEHLNRLAARLYADPSLSNRLRHLAYRATPQIAYAVARAAYATARQRIRALRTG